MRKICKLIFLSFLFFYSNISFGENFYYKALYKGIFSLGREIEVADITYFYKHPSLDSKYLESMLLISSEGYDAVESLYPMRYRYRSWYKSDYSSGIAAEVYSNSGSKGERHKLIYLDRPKDVINSHDLLKEGELDLPILKNGTYPLKDDLIDVNLFDRLGLLASIRSKSLSPQQEFIYKVSNGKKLLEYIVKVEKIDKINISNKTRDAFKLSLKGFKINDVDEKEVLHRPIYLWLSTDKRNIPLLVESKSTFGRLTIKIKE